MTSSTGGGGGGGSGPQGELQLLERVFFRLGMAETDEQLQEAISKFLPPVLLKLTSTNEGVRKKVMELLVHINKRIKNNNNIQLPVEALLLQYQDPAATSFVINFTIIYIKMGFPRLSLEKQMELIPAVLAGIEAKPTMHQDSLLLMIMPVLGELAKHPPGDPDKKKSMLGLCEKPAVSKVLYSFMFDYMLLPYGSHPSLKPADPKDTIQVPAGLSEYGWKRVSGESPTPAEQIEETRTGVMKFCGTGLLPEMEVAIHLLIGSSDTRHSVATASESVSRKLGGSVDWNDTDLIRKVYSLFLGTLVIKDRPQVKSEHKRQPANTRIRLKLMPVLIKSREAAMQFPSCIQVTFDLLFGTSGNSNAKLKMMAVQFVHQIIHHCPENRLSPIGAVILSALTRLVTEEKDNPKLRGSCYVAVGKLGLKIPALVNKDMKLITMFFDGLSTEGPDTQLSLKEALGIMTPAFRAIDAESKKFIEAMLSTYIEKEGVQVKLVTIQYAGEVFPHTNVPTRFVLLLGAGDKKEEIATAARTTLTSGVRKLNAKDNGILRTKKLAEDESILPDFQLMVAYVMEKSAIRIKSSYKQVVGNVTLPFTVKTGAELCDYIRLCLLHSAGIRPDLELLADPAHQAPIITRYLEKIGEESSKKLESVIKFADLVEKLLTGSQNIQIANTLLMLVGTMPKQIAPRYERKLEWLRQLLSNTKEDLREALAHVYGLVAATLNLQDFEKAIKQLVSSFKEKSLEHQHGILLAIGYAFGLNILKNKAKKKDKEWRLFRESIDLVLGELEGTQNLSISGGCLAIGEIGRCSSLPMDNEGDIGKVDNKLGVVEKLLGIVKSGKQAMKIRERAATSLGNICLGEHNFPHKRLLIQRFIELAKEIKEIELHFTIGDSLVQCALGPASPLARDIWTVSKEDYKSSVGTEEADDSSDLAWLLEKLVGELTQSTHPNLKQAGCLWLLAITKHCTEQSIVRSKLLEIQSAFMTLLGDNNDLVQDAASKGIGIVYESSSAEQREKLVKNLLDTLVGGRKEVAKVNQDTKVFAEGELGKNPVSGGNLSTYKELCGLATDMGQPDLVYKFMHLANYNATWNSRKGAAFGFSSIAAAAGDHLEQYLPKIIPKLYRYQFDPTPRIQQSMSAIWAALVPETTKTVDKYLSEILTELQKEVTSGQWRVRESCCTAITEILRGRTLDGCTDELAAIWIDVFRVMDDVKESVRLAATKTAQSLSRVSIKMCDVNTGAKTGEKAVKAILPPLLEKGLASNVTEVKAISIATIMKLTKSAGSLLEPHIHILIPSLLEATSEMEGTSISYLSTRLGADSDTQQMLDSARISSISGHPTMECVNFVLQYVNSSNLEQLIPRLIELIKGSPGLVTKGGTSMVINNLTNQCPLDLQPYTGKLLSALVSGLSDRNPAVRMQYAKSIGQLMRTAKESSKEKLFSKLKTWYMEKEDEMSRASVAYTFKGITTYSPDVMRNYANVAMPIAFLAMHEEKKTPDGATNTLQEIWEEIWQDGTPGNEGGIRLYLVEIMELIPKAMDSGQWSVKAQAARAMGTVCTKLGGTINPAVQKRIAALLIAALTGRTWAGKECIIRSLQDLVVYGGDGVVANLEDKSGDASIETMLEALFKECKKDKVEYKTVALVTTATIINHINKDLFKELYTIVSPFLEKSGGSDSAQETEDKEDKEDNLKLQEAIITSLGLAWPDCMDTQKKYIVEMLDRMEEIVGATTRKNQECVAVALGRIMQKWREPADIKTSQASLDLCEGVYTRTARILSTLLLVPKFGELRTKTLKVLGTVIKLLVDSTRASLVYHFRDEISKSLDGVIKDLASDPAIKTTARDLKASLNAITPEGGEEKKEGESVNGNQNGVVPME